MKGKGLEKPRAARPSKAQALGLGYFSHGGAHDTGATKPFECISTFPQHGICSIASQFTFEIWTKATLLICRN